MSRVRTSDKKARNRLYNTVAMAQTAVREHRTLAAETGDVAVACGILSEDIVYIAECVFQISGLSGQLEGKEETY